MSRCNATPFRKILIANRGEIALRIIRSARAPRLPHRGRVLHAPTPMRATCAGRPGRLHRRAAAGAVATCASRRIIEAASAQRRRCGASGLRLPGRERGLRAGLPGSRPGVHRPFARGDRRDGRQGRRQDADAGGRRALHSRLPGRRPERGAARRGGRAHRLPGDDQGQRPAAAGAACGWRHRRAEFAALLRSARSEAAERLRRPERDPRARRSWRRATSRSRSSPTATATRSISASATARCSAATRRSSRRRRRRRWTPELRERMGATARGRGQGHRLRGRGHARVPARRRGQLLLHGDEHAAAGRAPGDRGRSPGSTWWRCNCASRPASRCRSRRRRCASTGHAIEVRLCAEDAGAGLHAAERHHGAVAAMPAAAARRACAALGRARSRPSTTR